MDNNKRAFFELVKAGLWGDGNPDIRIDGTTDWNEVYQLAQEQSVQGLVLQGIDAVHGSWFMVKGSWYPSSAKGSVASMDWRGADD